MSSNQEPSYVPPLGFARLTPYFDAVARATLREEAWRPRLVAQARIEPGQRVLDLGCGTGSLTLQVLRSAPEARVVGLDPDPEALAIARGKLERAGLVAELREGRIDEARFEPASFDRVVSSLVFHHLAPDAKRRALTRVREWLRPGGELHIADWGRARSPGMRLAFVGIQLLDGFENTRDHVRAGLEPFMEEAGFADVGETESLSTVFGTLSLYRARQPAAERTDRAVADRQSAAFAPQL